MSGMQQPADLLRVFKLIGDTLGTENLIDLRKTHTPMDMMQQITDQDLDLQPFRKTAWADISRKCVSVHGIPSSLSILSYNIF